MKSNKVIIYCIKTIAFGFQYKWITNQNIQDDWTLKSTNKTCIIGMRQCSDQNYDLVNTDNSPNYLIIWFDLI